MHWHLPLIKYAQRVQYNKMMKWFSQMTKKVKINFKQSLDNRFSSFEPILIIA